MPLWYSLDCCNPSGACREQQSIDLQDPEPRGAPSVSEAVRRQSSERPVAPLQGRERDEPSAGVWKEKAEGEADRVALTPLKLSHDRQLYICNDPDLDLVEH